MRKPVRHKSNQKTVKLARRIVRRQRVERRHQRGS